MKTPHVLRFGDNAVGYVEPGPPCLLINCTTIVGLDGNVGDPSSGATLNGNAELWGRHVRCDKRQPTLHRLPRA